VCGLSINFTAITASVAFSSTPFCAPTAAISERHSAANNDSASPVNGNLKPCSMPPINASEKAQSAVMRNSMLFLFVNLIAIKHRPVCFLCNGNFITHAYVADLLVQNVLPKVNFIVFISVSRQCF
jgi:hypothetical protein